MPARHREPARSGEAGGRRNKNHRYAQFRRLIMKFVLFVEEDY